MDELDEDGYPTEELLETIRNWPWQQGFNGLMELVKRNWNWSDMMFCKEEDTYSISTGGWSGYPAVAAGTMSSRCPKHFKTNKRKHFETSFSR
jgi:hypothetical protein